MSVAIITLAVTRRVWFFGCDEALSWDVGTITQWSFMITNFKVGLSEEKCYVTVAFSIFSIEAQLRISTKLLSKDLGGLENFAGNVPSSLHEHYGEHKKGSIRL